ncbi:MAG: hypothetical protein F6J93_35875 [Oscillatoria sp. SIO1A7]|nr:hypothetical protein [Oscillatoria sp. SIO1A7]
MHPRAKHSNTIDFCEESIVSGMLSPLHLIDARENGEGIVKKTDFSSPGQNR